MDFAYEIHSEVGYHCIGAKVNGKIVPLDTVIRSGDQVEILTSKNQTPSPDWEKFAVTHKARSGIRRFLNEKRRSLIHQGREAWQKRAKKDKLHINDDELERIAHGLKYESKGDLFYDIGAGKMTSEEAAERILNFLKEPIQKDDTNALNGKILYNKFVHEARKSVSGDIVVDGGLTGIKYNYAKCCNPIPGDQVVGFIKTGRGITIHRTSCPNAIRMLEKPDSGGRALDVDWASKDDGFEFIAAIRVSGEDRPGMLNDITHAIVSYRSTNIRSVNIESQDSLFVGIVTVMVRHIEHLERLMERLKKIANIDHVERFEQGRIEDEE